VVDSPLIPIICGPTAAGKTGVAVALAEEFALELISADSRQMIRHLDIGTAKPTAAERAALPMHLIDIIEPGERYSAFRFIDDANRLIGEILKRGRLPIIVGGTGLYLRALTEGVVEIEQPDMELREDLERQIAEGHADELYKKLSEVDPLEASRIHPNNHVRLVRALEIYYVTGLSKSELIATGSYRRSQYRYVLFCLMPPRQTLYEIINQRVEAMLQAGLVAELEQLVRQGKREAIRKANVIGYQEVLDYLENRVSLAEAVALIKQNSRRYAKRQMTWFRAQAALETAESRAELTETLKVWLSVQAAPKK
jgi:tRNA dimethylallyltransferase